MKTTGTERIIRIALLTTAVFLPGPQSPAAPSDLIPLPPEGKFYHAAYPGGITGEEDDVTRADLESYEQTVGKSCAWVYFSQNWYRDRRFPAQTANWIRDRGGLPFIRLMIRDTPDQNVPNRFFTLRRILNGAFDADIRAWAAGAREFGFPVAVEFGTEVNGKWFPWNGVWNGGGERTGYGSPEYPDGPERFRDAYRRIIRLMRRQGATNIIWVFHTGWVDIPRKRWNHFEKYYPGDGFIDWLGVSVYGAQSPMEGRWPRFRDFMDPIYPRLARLSENKPIFVLEFGATARHPQGNQAQWAEDALTDILTMRWPRLKGFSWWNEAWENDGNPDHDTTMRVQDNPDLADVFQRLIGENSQVLGRTAP